MKSELFYLQTAQKRKKKKDQPTDQQRAKKKEEKRKEIMEGKGEKKGKNKGIVRRGRSIC